MRIALVHKAKYPVKGYGGTERLVWWIAKGLHEMGIAVVLAGEKGTKCPFAEVVTPSDWNSLDTYPNVDVFHLFNTPIKEPNRPYLVTIGGNGKPGESFLPNTVFISRNHAERHGSHCFVYNAVDPSEYEYRETKQDYLLFLAKAKWAVKNVKGAIRYSQRAGERLHILGGKSLFINHWKNLHWEGTVGGAAKAKWLAEAKGLLFPVIWHEPFGLAVVEAFASGTPVLASPYGSLPELVQPDVGRICETEEDFIDAIHDLGSFKPKRCREWMMENFHYHRMAKDYLKLYEKVLRGEKLNSAMPKTSDASQGLMPIGHRSA